MPKHRDDGDDHEAHSLAAAIQHYRAVYDRWVAEQEPSLRAVLDHQMHQAHEALWLMVGPLFLDVARWLIARRHWAIHLVDAKDGDRFDYVQSLAMIAYLGFIDELPRLTVDPERPVRALLKAVIRNTLYDEYKRLTRQREHLTDSLDQPAHPGAAAILGDVLPDETTLDADEQHVAAITREEVIQVIVLWVSMLAHIDQQIMIERIFRDPPTAFADIAALLGAGWQADAVRQRHARARQKLLQLLKERGWDECP